MTTTPIRAVPPVLETGRAVLGPALRDAVSSHLGPQMSRIAHYHFGWADAEGRPTGQWGGKMVRPALALLSARAAGWADSDGLPAALAIELVHNFSLLHDDIMDGDRTRRGRATAWTVFGVPNAILAGDAMVTAATSVLLAAPGAGARSAAASLMTATQRMIDGQAADVGFERRDDVTLSECLVMAGAKTGALLGSACSLGAELVGAGQPLVEGLRAFGEDIGLAFQLVDDLIGIWGDPARTGKQVGADLRVRKKSLPVVAALNAPGTDELRALYLGAGPMTESAVRRVTELVESAGGRDWAQDEAARRLTAAEDRLSAAGIPDDVRGDLLEVGDFIVGRQL